MNGTISEPNDALASNLSRVLGSTDWRTNFYTYQQPDRIVLLCIYVPVFVLALLGNLLVLLVLLVNQRMRSVTNYFLVNLAVADLLVAIFCIPMTAAESAYTVWLYGEFICRFTGFMQGLSIGESVLTILCMSVDRYLAINYPMKNRRLFTDTRVKWLIFITWLLAAIAMAPLMVVRELKVHQLVDHSVTFCHEDWPSQRVRQAYDIFLLFFIYVIPGTIVLFLYTRVGVRLWRPDVQLEADNSNMNNKARILTGRRRIARMMLIVSILFAICWLPYFIMMICLDFKVIELDMTVVGAYFFTVLLGHSNSAQNPILYCSMHKGFKSFLHNLLRCQFRKLRHYRQEYGSCRLHRKEAVKLPKNRNSQMSQESRLSRGSSFTFERTSTLRRTTGRSCSVTSQNNRQYQQQEQHQQEQQPLQPLQQQQQQQQQQQIHTESEYSSTVMSNTRQPAPYSGHCSGLACELPQPHLTDLQNNILNATDI